MKVSNYIRNFDKTISKVIWSKPDKFNTERIKGFKVKQPMKKILIVPHDTFYRLASIYYGMFYRCLKRNHIAWRYYGGRGIKVRMSFYDLITLWYRDKGYLFQFPSIDRKNNDGHYEYKNCRFISLQENSRRRHLKKEKN